VIGKGGIIRDDRRQVANFYKNHLLTNSGSVKVFANLISASPNYALQMVRSL